MSETSRDHKLEEEVRTMYGESLSSRQTLSGEFRPEAWYREHLLDAFEALGPIVRTGAVHKWLIERLRPLLSYEDFEKINSGRTERWWQFVHWNRQRLSDEGLVHPGRRAPAARGTYVSPHGRWELTEKGKRFIEVRKSRLESK
jgi:hypothetical protein